MRKAVRVRLCLPSRQLFTVSASKAKLKINEAIKKPRTNFGNRSQSTLPEGRISLFGTLVTTNRWKWQTQRPLITRFCADLMMTRSIVRACLTYEFSGSNHGGCRIDGSTQPGAGNLLAQSLHFAR
jgi:hypothetical protein